MVILFGFVYICSSQYLLGHDTKTGIMRNITESGYTVVCESTDDTVVWAELVSRNEQCREGWVERLRCQ